MSNAPFARVTSQDLVSWLFFFTKQRLREIHGEHDNGYRNNNRIEKFCKQRIRAHREYIVNKCTDCLIPRKTRDYAKCGDYIANGAFTDFVMQSKRLF